VWNTREARQRSFSRAIATRSEYERVEKQLSQKKCHGGRVLQHVCAKHGRRLGLARTICGGGQRELQIRGRSHAHVGGDVAAIKAHRDALVPG
jgi:hypothetical protein